MSDGVYANIRDIDQLGAFIGKRVVEITQHDQEDWDETHQSKIYLHFEDGRTLIFIIGDDGFEIDEPDDDPPEIAPPLNPA